MFGHKRRQKKSRTTEDKEEEKTRSQSPATDAQSVCPGLVSAARGQEGQQEDNSWTREGQEEDKTRPQSPARQQSPKQNAATEFRGAASQCGQLFFEIDPNNKLFEEILVFAMF